MSAPALTFTLTPSRLRPPRFALPIKGEENFVRACGATMEWEAA